MRYAFRRLLASPAFTLTALITMGAAIGANALIFSVVNGVLLKPLPFPDPDRLVGVWHVAPGLMEGDLNQSPANYLTYREARVFADTGLWNAGAVTVTGRGEPERVDALVVTDGTLPVVGVTPALGRLFTRDDDAPGSAETVLLSHDYWQRVFGARADAVGQSIVVDGRPRQVIGVLPEGFRFLRYNPSMVLPLRLDPAEVFVGNFSYRGVARLKPGTTIAEANADVARLIPGIPDRFPLPPGFSREMFDEIRMGPLVRPLSVDLVGDIGQVLWVLLGTVGIVLLVACANIANLFLVRAEGRQQELAVRTALGASRSQITGQLLSEALMLSLAGGALGLALASSGIRLLVALNPARLPRLEEIGLDPIVLLFTLALSVVAGVLFGLIPIVKYANPHLGAALKEGGRGSSDGRERHRARNTLVVAQVALALVLLVASGLMIRSFLAMRDVAPGFVDPGAVLTFRVSIPSALVEDPAATARMHEQIVRRLESLPGVTSVGLSTSITMDGANSNDPIFREDRPMPEGQMPPIRRFKWVSENFFRTMGNPLVAGRDFTWAETHGLRPVVIINDAFAREFYGSAAAALGQRIRNSPSQPWREIVGVVGDERDDGVTRPAPTIAYWPILMEDFWSEGVSTHRSLAYAVRTPRLGSAGFLPEVQQAVWSVNPNLPLARVETLQEVYDLSMAETSFALVILGIAAGVTLLLGLVGIYGVIAYIVSQRRREVGIRMALGAASGDVQRLFVWRGLLLTGIGLAVGLAASAGVMRLMSALLFGVDPVDPLTYAVVAGQPRAGRARRHLAAGTAGHPHRSRDRPQSRLSRHRARRLTPGIDAGSRRVPPRRQLTRDPSPLEA
ncbi:MAG: ABC transporter permease [Vicinamibacterales bacterium]|nr:ABC transporter permease [Vicinamibacterales bacterium]